MLNNNDSQDSTAQFVNFLGQIPSDKIAVVKFVCIELLCLVKRVYSGHNGNIRKLNLLNDH